jgi:hypothetical protein
MPTSIGDPFDAVWALMFVVDIGPKRRRDTPRKS